MDHKHHNAEDIDRDGNVVIEENDESPISCKEEQPPSSADDWKHNVLNENNQARQLRYLGQALSCRSLVEDCFLGMIEGTRARERQQTKFLDGVKPVLG